MRAQMEGNGRWSVREFTTLAPRSQPLNRLATSPGPPHVIDGPQGYPQTCPGSRPGTNGPGRAGSGRARTGMPASRKTSLDRPILAAVRAADRRVVRGVWSAR